MAETNALLKRHTGNCIEGSNPSVSARAKAMVHRRPHGQSDGQINMPIAFDNSYARLPERFFAGVAPARPPAPSLIRLNHALAADLGLDPHWLAGADGLEFLSGRTIAAGSEPIAAAYAGHQFGHFVPQLGDGRAILLGELLDREGHRRDLQLKGAGRTPFSRGGDGRAALGRCCANICSARRWRR